MYFGKVVKSNLFKIDTHFKLLCPCFNNRFTSVSDLHNCQIHYLNIIRMLLELTDNSIEAIALIKEEYDLENIIKFLTNYRVHDNENIFLQLGKQFVERLFLKPNNNSVHTLSKILIDEYIESLLHPVVLDI